MTASKYYNREYDELVQAADQYTQPFLIEEREEITEFKPGDMAIAMEEGSGYWFASLK